MAISFGRRGSGGGSGSSLVGFNNAQQPTTDSGRLALTDDTVKAANFHTPAFQVTQKSSAKASIVFAGTIVATFSGGSATGRTETEVRLQMRKASTENGFSGNTGWADVNIVQGTPIIFQETKRVNGSQMHQHISGEIPFDFSVLSGVNDNEWVQFQYTVKCDVPGTTLMFYLTKGSIALKSFGVGAASTDINGANIRDGSITNSEMGANSVGTSNIQNGAVTHDKLGLDSVENDNIANGEIEPVKLAGVDVSSANTGQILELDSAKTGLRFVDKPSGGGSGVPANDSITHAMLREGIVEQDNMADNSVGTDELRDDSITPAKLDGTITTGSSYAGHVITLDTTNGTEFAIRPYPTGGGGGGSSSFADITGINPTTKGGTGFNATDISDLRSKLGISTGGVTDPELVRSTDADTQKDNTIHRFDSNTSNRPTGATSGIIVRNGNDQLMVDTDSGHQWNRSISNTGTGNWSNPVAATITGGSPDLKRLQTESDFRTFAEGDRGYTDTTNWLPQFSDGSRPTKVIVGRNGNYLVAIDRNNFFWAPRPTVGTWTEIPWRWEGTSNVPAGLYYTGGETDERLIPAGEDAVIGGKTNIPGENFVALLVDHQVASGTSTFTGFYVDDDSGKTLRKTTNTVGNTVGTWARTRLDLSGISTNIFVPDTDEDGNERPAFVGVVPAISDLHFADYTYKTSLTGISEGDVAYISSSRTVWVYHKTTDTHLPTLFAIDYEVSLHKDDSNFIRGVFDDVNTFNLGGGVTLSGGIFRAADLNTTGTLSSGDTVSIRGHKAVLTKTDSIDSVNLANTAITPDKINGVTGASGVAGQVLALDNAKTGFQWADNSGGGGGGATNIAGLASEYSVLDSSYTFQSDVSSGVDDNKFGYTDSGSNGQIAFNVLAADSSAVSSWTTGTIFVLYKDSTNFVIGRATAAPQTEAGDSTEGAVSVTELERQGTFANGDSLKLYYGSYEPGSVVQIDNEGEPTVGHLLPQSMAIPTGTTFGSRVITTNSNSNGFLAVDPSSVGMIKRMMIMRQTSNLSNIGTSRVPLTNQTGTWTMANRSTDWVCFNAGGLAWFGEIVAGPICLDVEVWVRWKSGTDPYQAWSLSNSRVSAVNLGSDRLMVVKLFAGGGLQDGALSSATRDSSHVDCSAGSGNKWIRLSELNTSITDGTEFQFTLAFQRQDIQDDGVSRTPSYRQFPSYQARNWWLTATIADGSFISA